MHSKVIAVNRFTKLFVACTFTYYYINLHSAYLSRLRAHQLQFFKLNLNFAFTGLLLSIIECIDWPDETEDCSRSVRRPLIKLVTFAMMRSAQPAKNAAEAKKVISNSFFVDICL